MVTTVKENCCDESSEFNDSEEGNSIGMSREQAYTPVRERVISDWTMYIPHNGGFASLIKCSHLITL